MPPRLLLPGKTPQREECGEAAHTLAPALQGGTWQERPTPGPASQPGTLKPESNFSKLALSPPHRQTHLAKDVFNVTSTQLVAPQVKVAHDVPVPGSDTVVLALIAAAEGVIVRAKFQVERRTEGWPIIQALGVSLQQAHPAQECEAQVENTRREPWGQTTRNSVWASMFPQHLGPGNSLLLLPSWVGLTSLPKFPPPLPISLPSFSPSHPAPSSPRWFLRSPFSGLVTKHTK